MEFAIFLRRVRPEPFSFDTIRRHVAGLEQLESEGRLIAAGPMADGSAGLVLAHFDSLADAERFAGNDPYVTEGYETAEVHHWQWAHRRNGYLGVVPPLTAEREDIEFESCGARLRGWLYRAATTDPSPGIVMAHGLSAVKEMFLDDYAAAFAHAGFTTLVYDHFGFGASDGEPRQSPAADLQLQGYRDAIAWLASHESVDTSRIGIWGSSLSGGEVITLASEPLSIACAVAQVPYLGVGAPGLPSGALGAIQRALENGDTDATIPAVTDTADGEGIMFVDSAYTWFTRIAEQRAPRWRNELLIAGMASAAAYLPIDNLAKARVPLRLIVAPDDQLTPPGSAIPVAAETPNVDIVEIPGGHFDAYESGFTASSTHAVEWFRSHLMR